MASLTTPWAKTATHWTHWSCFLSQYSQARILGVFKMTNEAGGDDKLLCVVDDPRSERYQDIGDVEQHLKDEIEHFFTRYKDWSQTRKLTVPAGATRLKLKPSAGFQSSVTASR